MIISRLIPEAQAEMAETATTYDPKGEAQDSLMGELFRRGVGTDVELHWSETQVDGGTLVSVSYEL